MATSKRAAAIWASLSAITSVTIFFSKDPSLPTRMDIEDPDGADVGHFLRLRRRRSLFDVDAVSPADEFKPLFE